jgi:tRNA-specific 2-thiouridylase
MSGGVDSSVAALVLLRSGYEVHGLHMTNWTEDDAYCTAAEDYQMARQVCADLDVPLHRVNFSADYRRQVFDDFEVRRTD